MTPPAVVADFKSQFTREFVYGVSQDKVMDADITRALYEATSVFNSTLWADSDEIKRVFLYAAAHFLVLNLQAAGGLFVQNLGIGAQSRGGGVVQSKTVGGVTVNYMLPESLTGDAILSGFMRTDFGLRYLQVLVPRLVGQCFAVDGFNENAILANAIADQSNPNLLNSGNFTFSADQDVIAFGMAVAHYCFVVASTTEVSARVVMGKTGTLSALRIAASANTLSHSTPITLIKNGSAENMTFTLGLGEIAGQDSVTQVQVAAGDTIDIKVDISGSTSGELSNFAASLTFE